MGKGFVLWTQDWPLFWTSLCHNRHIPNPACGHTTRPHGSNFLTPDAQKLPGGSRGAEGRGGWSPGISCPALEPGGVSVGFSPPIAKSQRPLLEGVRVGSQHPPQLSGGGFKQRRTTSGLGTWGMTSDVEKTEAVWAASERWHSGCLWSAARYGWWEDSKAQKQISDENY